MFQTLNFSGARIINAAATFFRYESGAAAGADESIRLRADGQDMGIYYPGDAVEIPDQRGAWEIIPTTAACAGVVRLGIGRVESARLVGNVRVIDAAYQDVVANQCFVGVGSCVGVNTGLPAVQLWNPAGSGVRTVVDQITVGSSVSSPFALVSTTTQAAVNIGFGANLHAGQIDGSAIMKYDVTGTAFAAQKQLAGGWLMASQDRIISLKNPIVLEPGTGLYVVATASQVAALNCSFFHRNG